MLALCAVGLLVVGQLYTVLPLLGLFADSWSTTTAAAGLTATVFGFGYATGFLFSGPLSDRFGRRRLIVTGLTLTAAATAATALAPNLVTGCAVRAVQGLCAATFAPAAFAYIAERIAPTRRATAMTWLTSSFLAAGVLGQVLAQSLAAVVGWRGVFTTGAIALAAGAVALRFVLGPDRTSTGGSTLDAYRAMGRLLTNPAVTLLLLATLTLLGGFVALYTGLQVAGPPDISGNAGTLLALRASALPAMLLVPLFTTRLSKLPAAQRVGSALLFAGLISGLTALFGRGGDIGVLALGALLFVFVFGIAVAAPALVEAIGSLAGPARGAAVALYTFVLFVGASLGPQLAALLDNSFSTVATGVAVLLIGGAAAATLGHRLRHRVPAGEK
ncbi:Predicted arabinose efflux permease, MFS family [Actinopolyspora xinjiangensis]|uniref:Predicted arabinose efflux permease, MFS family n=1 Tax=Actinopolyspora xinjiangensis TaxID=405564 RepID=A0A1H0PC37_9ACTN|nr:MFS transporter [Actinopolyspora xinjiangensis]SDP02662.1 Predicted arabinose efflux permease, MFS family [Actinopolyspora xinjiangensis]